jgi:hypothetical protein
MALPAPKYGNWSLFKGEWIKHHQPMKSSPSLVDTTLPFTLMCEVPSLMVLEITTN